MEKLKPVPKIVLLNTDTLKVVRHVGTSIIIIIIIIIIQVLYVSASQDYSLSPSI
jgi:hypothetical protein